MTAERLHAEIENFIFESHQNIFESHQNIFESHQKTIETQHRAVFINKLVLYKIDPKFT